MRSNCNQHRAVEFLMRNRRLGFERLEPRAVLSGSGLTGQYFHNVDFTGLAVERTEAVDFNWDAASPEPGLNADSFSVRWFGQLEAEFSEVYTLRTVSDEGVRLWIDGQLLIDDWTAHVVRTRSATISLQAGQRYDIRLEYFDNLGAAQIRLQWLSASQPLEAVPATQLYASQPGIWGEYSDDAGGAAARRDVGISFNWGAGPSIAGVAADDFRVRWTGLLRPDFSERYDFSTLSDDGVRLWIGDELIIDHWTSHPATTDTGSKLLEAGKWYDVRLEYFDGVGDAQIELAWSSERQTGLGEFETIGSSHLLAAKHTPLTFTNPLGPGADPYVVQWQNSYLLVRSSGNSVWIDQAGQLQDIHASDPASISKRAWTAPSGTNYSQQIWAPELHQIGGKWYIYVAASNGDNATHRMHVLERDDPDPMGSFTYKGQIVPNADRWAIDGTVLQWQGQMYFIWSGWPGLVDGQQNLYISAMSNPWTLTGGRVLLSSPDLSWERNGLPINEGPQVLIENGQLHIIYSASGYWRHEYALGRLTYNGAGSILNPASWSKAPLPVFKALGAVVGTGHASFTTSPDGSQHWIVYHAHHDANNWQDDRDVRLQTFTFNSDGTPNFGAPLPSATVLEAPSGHADADRPLLSGDYDANGAVDAMDLEVLTATFGHVVFPGSGADGNGNGIVDAADITVWGDSLGTQAPAESAVADQSVAPSRASAVQDDSEYVDPQDAALADLESHSLAPGIAMPSPREAAGVTVLWERGQASSQLVERQAMRARAVDGMFAELHLKVEKPLAEALATGAWWNVSSLQTHRAVRADDRFAGTLDGELAKASLAEKKWRESRFTSLKPLAMSRVSS